MFLTSSYYSEKSIQRVRPLNIVQSVQNFAHKLIFLCVTRAALWSHTFPTFSFLCHTSVYGKLEEESQQREEWRLWACLGSRESEEETTNWKSCSCSIDDRERRTGYHCKTLTQNLITDIKVKSILAASLVMNSINSYADNFVYKLMKVTVNSR